MSANGTLIRRSPGALWRRVVDEVLVALPGRDDIQKLVGPAAAAWALLELPRAIPELVEELSQIYGVERHRIASDVEHLVSDLLARGSIVEVGSR